MQNPDLHLNTKLFDANPQKASMREGFGQGLVLAGDADSNVVVACADLTESTHVEAFKKKYPQRFVEVGVAEQNLATMASGMAAMGKIPFAASYAVFSPGRNWEQIRTTICYNDQPVKIIGSHAGLTVGADGGSHQALEDIALMRALPRMVVISPCDAIEARKAAQAAAKNGAPTYVRLARDTTPLITSDHTPFEIGKAELVFASAHTGSKRTSYDVGIITTGPSLYRALRAAHKLVHTGKNVAVMNLHTVKPLDEQAVLRLAHEAGAIVTVEDHQLAGGMGSAVAEFLTSHFPVPQEFVAVKDAFGQSGTADELIEAYGLSEKHIYDAAQRASVRKL